MKQFLSLLAAAVLGSAATVAVISVRTQKKTEDLAPAKAVVATETVVKEPPAQVSERAPERAERPPMRAEDAPRPPDQNGPRFGGGKNGGKMGGMLADVEGVSPENMNKIRMAFMKAFQTSEGVKTARARLMELGKQAEYASEQEKMDMRKDFEEAMEDMRKATRTALTEADPSIAAEDIDRVLEAVEERRKAQGMQGRKK